MEEITEAEDCAADCAAPSLPPAMGNSRRNSGAAAAAAPAGKCYKPIAPVTSCSEKAVGSSPKHLVSTLSSPIEQIACSVSREHALKCEIEQLQERLKDTEERLASVRLQSGSLSQTQRALREQNGRLQEESEVLKLDVQHLHECAGVLRTELQAARRDRDEAMQLERSLRLELKEAQQERRNAVESKEKDARIIQDLQRQCHEMERILIRKHPDSVSALIGKCPRNLPLDSPPPDLLSRCSCLKTSGNFLVERSGEREQSQIAGAAHSSARIGCQGAGPQGAADSGQCAGAFQFSAGQVRDAHRRPGDAGAQVSHDTVLSYTSR